MKLTLTFMAIFVAISHQQYHGLFLIKAPWMSPINNYNQQPFLNKYSIPNYYSYVDDQPGSRLLPLEPNNEDAELETFQIMRSQFPNNQLFNGFNDDIQGRIKGFGFSKPGFGQQQNAGRFFFNNNVGGVAGNPLLKTVTLLITSTCTALTVKTCIPNANIKQPAVACARKRQISVSDMLDEDNQFPIAATQVQIVMPTRESDQAPERVSRQKPFEISSSKEEGDDDYGFKGYFSAEQNIRKARFLYNVWQSFATGVTSTSWFVTSITSTKTYTPATDNAGVPAFVTLSCIPPGYITC